MNDDFLMIVSVLCVLAVPAVLMGKDETRYWLDRGRRRIKAYHSH